MKFCYWSFAIVAIRMLSNFGKVYQVKPFVVLASSSFDLFVLLIKQITYFLHSYDELCHWSVAILTIRTPSTLEKFFNWNHLLCFHNILIFLCYSFCELHLSCDCLCSCIFVLFYCWIFAQSFVNLCHWKLIVGAL